MSLHMLDYLCRQGIVIPSGSEVRGRGRARRYTFADIVLLRVISKLLDQGISVLRCKKSLLAMRRHRPNMMRFLGKKYLLTDGVDVFLQNNGVLERIDSGQTSFAFVLGLASVREDVAAKLESKRSVG
jgi:DNA-binding transcriptional MerR regulator